MSHRQQQEFVASVRTMFPFHFQGRRVLDVGSMDVNGTTRPLFLGGSYLGIDLYPGKGVDRVCPAWEVEGEFDVVISCECLEHDETWVRTLGAMEARVARGGLLIVTCAGPGRGEHGTRKHPQKGMVCETDYYKNLAPCDLLCALHMDLWASYGVTYRGDCNDTYLWALRR
jgi:hypothetical protein